MNKLIKKLIEENLYLSWKDDVQDYTVSSASLEELEDLVKAVVRECASACESVTKEGEPLHLVSLGYAQKIKDHFGVE